MAKVSDFELSLMGPEDNESHLSLHTAGTLGYVDPRYYWLQVLTSKSDVYSFGVVLLKLLSSYRAIHNNEHGVPRNVVDFLIPYILQDEIHRVLDRKVLLPNPIEIEAVRNGHAPIFLWYTLNRKGYKGFQKEVQKCLRNAHYLKGRLREAGISAMLNELSSTVVFERPSEEEFVRRWQLACEGNIAHVVVMPSVSIEKLDGFVNELIEKRSTWYRDGTVQPPCLAVDIGAENCCCALHK
ncbi:hypothetical protein EUGRSUZ_L02502 [Eucalyptus grandis]|uniref:Protein kinase domain-containing protein n=1 Tax=Eucalyptus grandis TaxID=71139 RepID=A0A058ZRV0_EUCGR|nr:hypothetical protein EUGRSUZ_L02502 [Eucalyptus grandis]